MSAKYLVSFSTSKNKISFTHDWQFWAMMPTTTETRYIDWTRHSMTLTEQEGDFLLANQGKHSPSWSILFKALSGRSFFSEGDLPIKDVQIEDITGMNNLTSSEYISTAAV